MRKLTISDLFQQPGRISRGYVIIFSIRFKKYSRIIVYITYSRLFICTTQKHKSTMCCKENTTTYCTGIHHYRFSRLASLIVRVKGAAQTKITVYKIHGYRRIQNIFIYIYIFEHIYIYIYMHIIPMCSVYGKLISTFTTYVPPSFIFALQVHLVKKNINRKSCLLLGYGH